MSRKWRVLTPEERVKVVKEVNSGKSCRSIASELDVGKTDSEYCEEEG